MEAVDLTIDTEEPTLYRGRNFGGRPGPSRDCPDRFTLLRDRDEVATKDDESAPRGATRSRDTE